MVKIATGAASPNGRDDFWKDYFMKLWNSKRQSGDPRGYSMRSSKSEKLEGKLVYAYAFSAVNYYPKPGIKDYEKKELGLELDYGLNSSKWDYDKSRRYG
ncbi:MAG: hypothetical protein MUF61_01650 [archaeon]|jgi:hypothetical protein|nr:hypothetical protein [archaeon]